MKIAVIDDQPMIHEQFQRVLFEEEVYCFTEEALFMQTLEQTAYDLIFLDICLNDTIGYVVGEAIRRSALNDRAVIVYISNTTDYVVRLFKTQPFDFLQKPIQDEELRTLLERIKREKLRHFTIQTRKAYIHVPLHAILYFHSDMHRIYICADHQTHTIYDKLENLQLPAPPFLRIHQSVIINTTHVSRFSRSDIEMDDGKVFTISRRYRDAVMKYMMEVPLE